MLTYERPTATDGREPRTESGEPTTENKLGIQDKETTTGIDAGRCRKSTTLEYQVDATDARHRYAIVLHYFD